MAKLAIKLNKNIPCEYICSKISDIVKKYKITESSLLTIDIVETINSNDSLLPKIEFKNEAQD